MALSAKTIAAIVTFCICSVAALGDDWPQWLGPRRDSVWREKGIVKTFPQQGLKVKWRVPVAGGFAGPAVADGKVYVADYVVESGKPVNGPSKRCKLEGQERLLCFSADDGSLVWKHEYACSYDVSYPAGPRVTPTVVDGKVYTLGTMGDLCCLDADTGKLLWSMDFKEQYNTKTPIWGFAGHPLVEGNTLFCLAGGKDSVAVALDKDTGREIWRSLSAPEPGYCPPVMIDAGGRRQLVIWHSTAVNGLDPRTGKVYWSVPLKPSYGMSIATPRKSGNYLFACGIGHKAVLLTLDPDRPGAEIVWRGDSRTAVYCANSTPIIDGNVIYGVCRQGELRGVELSTGRRLWETCAATTGSRPAYYATAFIVKHEDRYFLFNDKGDLILARLSPEGYKEISRFNVLEPTDEGLGREVVWSHPAFANQSVYARNDKELVCVSLAVATGGTESSIAPQSFDDIVTEKLIRSVCANEVPFTLSKTASDGIVTYDAEFTLQPADPKYDFGVAVKIAPVGTWMTTDQAEFLEYKAKTEKMIRKHEAETKKMMREQETQASLDFPRIRDLIGTPDIGLRAFKTFLLGPGGGGGIYYFTTTDGKHDIQVYGVGRLKKGMTDPGADIEKLASRISDLYDQWKGI